MNKPLAIFGDVDDATLAQARRCLEDDRVVQVALMADNHKGYSVPIGGVVAYDNAVSPAGVGYDIGCGNTAFATPFTARDLSGNVPKIMDRIWKEVNFGMGSKSDLGKDHPIFSDDRWGVLPEVKELRELARTQIGSVGSGNHYVDLLVERRTSRVWVGTHFGSRGFGHKTASGFLNLLNGRSWLDRAPGESMDNPPKVVSLDQQLGQEYWVAMSLAGAYALAGRDLVVHQVVNILYEMLTGSPICRTPEELERMYGPYSPGKEGFVRNNHNLAWLEIHEGRQLVVVRKGATPAFPGQFGFIGGSMADPAYIVAGATSQSSEVLEQQHAALFSTVHGAGRIMSRTQAAGKLNRKTRERSGGLVTRESMEADLQRALVVLRGAGLDEAPQCYKRIEQVIAAQGPTIDVVHVLDPVGVAMAGPDIRDDYKD